MLNQNRRGYREEVQNFTAQLGERRLPLGLGCAYIGGVGAYRAHCDQLAADGYPGFAFSAP